MVYSIALLVFFLDVRVRRKRVQLFWLCGVFIRYSLSFGSRMLFFGCFIRFCFCICIYPFSVALRHGRFFYLLCQGFCCFYTGVVHFHIGIFRVGGVLFISESSVASAHIALAFSLFYPVINYAVRGVFPMNCKPCFSIKRAFACFTCNNFVVFCCFPHNSTFRILLVNFQIPEVEITKKA